MSQSEFVRTMVQAGRKAFEPVREEPGSGGADPGGDRLETRIFELLSEEPRSWGELLEVVNENIETRLDDTLEELQAQDRIRHSGRHNGYVIVEGEGDGE